MEAIEQRSFAEAVSALEEYLANPHGTRTEEAPKLLAAAEIALSDDKARTAVEALSDSQLGDLANHGKLPPQLTTDNNDLNEAVQAALAQ